MREQDLTICPFCGAGARRSCEMESELGICPAEEADHDFETPDHMEGEDDD